MKNCDPLNGRECIKLQVILKLEHVQCRELSLLIMFHSCSVHESKLCVVETSLAHVSINSISMKACVGMILAAI